MSADCVAMAMLHLGKMSTNMCLKSAVTVTRAIGGRIVGDVRGLKSAVTVTRAIGGRIVGDSICLKHFVIVPRGIGGRFVGVLQCGESENKS